jgi:hypothetical protein
MMAMTNLAILRSQEIPDEGNVKVFQVVPLLMIMTNIKNQLVVWCVNSSWFKFWEQTPFLPWI